MVNMLICVRDISEVKELFNEIISVNKNIRIDKIATTQEEVIKAFNNNKIDVILLESSFIKQGILNKISEYLSEKFKDSIMVITNNFKEIQDIIKNEMIFDYIIKGSSKNEMLYKINRMIEGRNSEEKKKSILNELKYIGYNVEYVGTNYLAETILQMYINKDLMLDNLQRDIYPIVSKKYNKSVHNIKCNITRATDCMYYECDSERLKDYFGFYDDTKPTAKTVVFTILNKIE